MLRNRRTLRALGAGIIMTLLIAAYISPLLAQGGTHVKFEPEETTIGVGETQEVAVVIENVTNLAGVEIYIVFDPTVVEVMDADPDKEGVQVARGDLLGLGYEINEVSEGMMEYVLTVLGQEPASGSGEIIRITFRGIAEGSTHLTFDSVLLADPQSSGIGASMQNGYITVGSDEGADDVTPPPPTPTRISPPIEETPTEEAPPSALPTPTPPPPMPTPTPQPEAVSEETRAPSAATANCGEILGYHIVRRGETLYMIGRAYATRPDAIAACNQLLNPRVVHVSNRLAIPNAPWIPTPAGIRANRQFGPPQPPPSCRYMHTVHYGETLTLLSARYGTTVWRIAEANHLSNPNLIIAGQQLCIP